MTALLNGLWKVKIWKDARGQDLVEYALLAGFVVTVAAAASPVIGAQISTIFSTVAAQLQSAGGSTGNVSPAS